MTVQQKTNFFVIIHHNDQSVDYKLRTDERMLLRIELKEGRRERKPFTECSESGQRGG